jgi:hypothetical protein
LIVFMAATEELRWAPARWRHGAHRFRSWPNARYSLGDAGPCADDRVSPTNKGAEP